MLNASSEEDYHAHQWRMSPPHRKRWLLQKSSATGLYYNANPSLYSLCFADMKCFLAGVWWNNILVSCSLLRMVWAATWRESVMFSLYGNTGLSGELGGAPSVIIRWWSLTVVQQWGRPPLFTMNLSYFLVLSVVVSLYTWLFYLR